MPKPPAAAPTVIRALPDMDRALRGEHRPPQGQRRVYPGPVPALTLEVPHENAAAWVFRYRPRGTDPTTGKRHPQTAMKVGTSDQFSPKQATEKADALKARVAAGGDPLREDRHAALAAAQNAREAERARKTERDIAALQAAYVAEALPSRGLKPRSLKDEGGKLALALRALGMSRRPLREVRSEDIERAIRAAPPGSRFAWRGVLHRFFDWCVAHTALSNPAEKVRGNLAPAPAARRRILSPTEVASVWAASDGVKNPLRADLVRFLCAVPCRNGEALSARWQDIDFGARTWTIGDTKNGEPHRYFLSDTALEILRRGRASVPTAPGDALVFPSEAGTVIKSTSDLKIEIDALSGVRGWVFHDLRRTIRTAIAEHGVGDDVAELLIGHKRKGIVGVYNHAHLWAERVRATMLWDSLLHDALQGRRTETWQRTEHEQAAVIAAAMNGRGMAPVLSVVPVGAA